PVSSEEEALAFIGQVKKKYWDAKHNCFAYVIGTDNELARCSDDGEPSKTAGRPMLDVLLAEGIHDAAVVVTRYFGGVLLGTGGLVRAYQAAVKAGLTACTLATRNLGKKLVITTDYSGIGKLQYIAASENISLLSTEYTDAVTVTLFVTPSQESIFIKKFTQATNGQAKITVEGEGFFEIVTNS
ncbi:MAG: YigZ family protein, partial [Lachnospiraceae bacterium]|nr:YigZ family protein [Lachnospiraceae bacterium]